jgi:hypothetical protein
MLDTPTNNFATWNPLFMGGVNTGDSSNTLVLKEGNLQQDFDNTSFVTPTIRGVGKCYYEVYWKTNSTYGVLPGYVNDAWTGSSSDRWEFYYRTTSSDIWRYANNTNSVINTSYGAGDILQFAWDTDSGNCWLGRNNAWYDSSIGTTGNPTTGANPTFTLTATQLEGLITGVRAEWGTSEIVANFGQDSSFAGNKTGSGNYTDGTYGDFFYEPPSGFLALCTKNLPDPAVIPGEHFNAVTYTGNGGAQTITTGFAPDLIWIKQRNGADWHHLFDEVRGHNNALFSNDTQAESTKAWGMSLNADSFSTTTSNGAVNGSGSTYVAWNWKANGAGVSNTNGSITSTVSANVAAGFSIVSYTSPNTTVNETIGHGLSKAPEFIMAKNRDNAYNWDIYHEALAPGGGLIFDTASTRAGWTTTIPDASVFTAKYQYEHESTNKYIAYCFHSVEGYCKVGTYTGNTSVDGTFIYLGFKPAYILSRVPTALGWHWNIYDNKMDTTNPTGSKLLANRSDAEYADGPYTNMDFVSNGIKIRTSEGQANTGEFVYIAFAEQPFKYTNAK